MVVQINVSNRDALIIGLALLVAATAMMYPDAAAATVASFGEWLAGVAA